MMQKRTLFALLLMACVAVFASSVSANEVIVQSKNAERCNSTTVDIDAVVSAAAVSAVEIVLEITGDIDGAPTVAFQPGFTDLSSTRIIDLSQADGVSPDTVRIAALRTDSVDTDLMMGTTSIARLTFPTADACGGTIVVDNVVFNYDTTGTIGTITTQFVGAGGAGLLPVAVTAGTVTLVNAVPTFTSTPADTSLPWGSLYTSSILADDADLANSCEALTYSLVSGPADFNVNPSTGSITWQTDGDDVCVNEVVIAVTDSCGESVQYTYEICVTNEAPVLACTSQEQICGGDTLNFVVDASDPDNGPRALVFGIDATQTTLPGAPVINPATGEVTWDPMGASGVYTLAVTVSDSANVCDPCSPRNADTCLITINVLNNVVSIEQVEDVLQGQYTNVSINIADYPSNNSDLGGFDLLIEYDPSALSLVNVDPGQFIADCGWEYFEYRFGPNACQNGACPSGKVRIVGLAETNNGANNADCFNNDAPTISSELANMQFLVTNDRTLECQTVPIRFCWVDCGDNALSNEFGDTLFISSRVFDWTGVRLDLLPEAGSLPGVYGAPSPECDVSDKGAPYRCVDFVNGYVDIICADSIDDRGDINVNGLAYEIADAVMFTQYFLTGLSAFQDHIEASIAASDVNADGNPLTVADLVTTIRVVLGDELGVPKALPVVAANYRNHNGVFSVEDVEVGAAHFVLAGNVEPTNLTSAEMGYAYDMENNVTNVLVYPAFTGVGISDLSGVSGDIINTNGAEVIDFSLATIAGSPVAPEWLPSTFALEQNYPNPFNPTTTIAFDLAKAGNWALTIYNVNGQVVTEFSGFSNAGTEEIVWDAASVASGVYFYKLAVDGQFSATKKMVFLK